MKEVIKIANPKQASLYMKHGLKCTCYWSVDKVIYEFDKEETKPLFELWRNYKLK